MDTGVAGLAGRPPARARGGGEAAAPLVRTGDGGEPKGAIPSAAAAAASAPQERAGSGWSLAAVRDLSLGLLALSALALLIHQTGGLPNSYTHLAYLPLLLLAFRVPASGALLGALLAGLLVVVEVATRGTTRITWFIWPLMFLTVTAIASRWAGLIRQKAEAEWELATEIRTLNEELEQRVIERTGQLEAANKELEAFSYTVSHDLRTPLRAVDGFSRILLEQRAGELPAETGHYLEMVRGGAQRMGQLIDDLLAFSRLGRQPLKKQLVAPAEVVGRVLEDLHERRDGRRVEVSIGDLPACWADPALLTHVYTNLLDNALKFTQEREAARIEIGCQQVHGEPAYFVRDNGAGFDMRYAGKLFGVFQRLHRAEEFEGTGVGLAIVQRIIHRHGGRVWAEGETGQGATFFFTLPGGTSGQE